MNEGSIQIETVKTDTFTMNYFKFGHGEKIFVILPGLSVQSVMGSAEAVADAYQILTDDCTVYVFDRRNELPETYTVFDIANDTAKAFRTLGLKNINLFGASQGGMAAMKIAITNPDLTESLVLSSTTARITENQFETIENWIKLAEDNNSEGLYLAFGEAVYPQNTFEQSRQLFIDAAKTVTDEELDRFVILAKGIKGFDVINDLENINCPVFVIGDRKDQLMGEYPSIEIGEYLKNSPDFELHIYNGYGHAAYDTAPDFKERILQFLQRSTEN